MKLSTLKEKGIANEQEILELAMNDVAEVTMENIEKVPLTAKSKRKFKDYSARAKAKSVPYQFLTDENDKIYGVEMDVSLTFPSGKAEYSYLKLQESDWDETDYYGHTKCTFKGRTITTLVAVSLNTNVSFGDYNFPSKKLEHQVAKFIQKVANRLDERIKSQK